MNAQQVTTMRRLWIAQYKVRDIAIELHVKLRRVQRYMEANRHLFPERKGTKPRTAFQKPLNEAPRAIPSDRMRFTTSTGYVCTMPRISILEAR